jgi:hypothetical protein
MRTLSQKGRNVTRRRWTEDELTTLRKHYLALTIEEVEGLLPGRSRHAIYCQAQTLGLRHYERILSEPFSAQECDRLRTLYANARPAELRKAFPGRTVGEVVQQAREMGLRKARGIYDPDRNYDGGPVIIHLPESERWYIAGLFDGEGHFSFVKRRGSANGRYYYRLHVAITNTNQEVLDWLTHRIPSKVFEKEEQGGRRRKVYRWSIQNNERARMFAKEIAPMLIIKQAEAELVASDWKQLSFEEQEDLAQRLKDLRRSTR